MMAPEIPDERPLVRPVFLILVCAGYVSVVFLFFLMFRTVIFPS
jgi:hypothetical protein